MSIATFSIGIYKAGGLVKSSLVNVDWDIIDERVAELESLHPGCVIECVEHDEYCGQYDDENCGIVQH